MKSRWLFSLRWMVRKKKSEFVFALVHEREDAERLVRLLAEDDAKSLAEREAER